MPGGMREATMRTSNHPTLRPPVSSFKPVQFRDLKDKSHVTIYIGSGAWKAAEQYKASTVTDEIAVGTGADTIAFIGGAADQPLVLTTSQLEWDRPPTLASKQTHWIGVEQHGDMSLEDQRRVIELINAQSAPDAQVTLDGEPWAMVGIMREVAKIRGDVVNGSLRDMAPSERAELLEAKYAGGLAMNALTRDLYCYTGANWEVVSPDAMERQMVAIYKANKETFSPTVITSAIEVLKMSVPIMGTPPRNIIGFSNGVIDTASGAFRRHSKDDWLLNILNVEYQEAADGEALETHAPNFSRWLQWVAQGRKRDRILAALFMVLANKHDWQLFLEVTGAGGTGKSVFAELCKLMAGEQNTNSASIEAIEKSRERAALVGYSLIILPDQPKWQGEGAGLKAITGGDAVSIDPKYKAPFSIRIPAVILAVNNTPMSFSDRTGGIARRRVLFGFDNVVPEAQRDSSLISKIAGELPVIIRHMLTKFADQDDAKALLHEQQKSAEALDIKRGTDPLMDFCGYLINSDNLDGLMVGSLAVTPTNPRKYLYHAYITFMEAKNHKHPLNLTAFGKAMISAMEEHGGSYQRHKTRSGFITNVKLNEDLADEWLYGSSVNN